MKKKKKNLGSFNTKLEQMKSQIQLDLEFNKISNKLQNESNQLFQPFRNSDSKNSSMV